MQKNEYEDRTLKEEKLYSKPVFWCVAQKKGHPKRGALCKVFVIKRQERREQQEQQRDACAWRPTSSS